MLQVEAEFKDLEGALKAEDKERVLELRRSIEKFADQRPAPLPTAMTVTDIGRSLLQRKSQNTLASRSSRAFQPSWMRSLLPYRSLLHARILQVVAPL